MFGRDVVGVRVHSFRSVRDAENKAVSDRKIRGKVIVPGETGYWVFSDAEGIDGDRLVIQCFGDDGKLIYTEVVLLIPPAILDTFYDYLMLP